MQSAPSRLDSAASAAEHQALDPLRYELDGEKGTIEGWLVSSESNNVKIKISGPADWHPHP